MKYPKHAKYKKRGPANSEEMDAMFDKAHVTGTTSYISGEILDNTDDEDDVLEVEESHGDEQVTVASLKKAKKSVKHKAQDIDESAKEEKNPFLREYKNTLGLINLEVSLTHSLTSRVPTMQEVLKLMKECRASEGTSLFHTATKIVMNPDYRELFMLIETKEGRLDWLQRTHDEMSK